MLPMMTNNYRNAMNWMPAFFNEFLDEFPTVNNAHTTSPAINVHETDKAYNLDFAVPGITKEMASVQLTEDGNLMVKIENKQEDEKKAEDDRSAASADASLEGQKKRWLRREFSYTSYSQAFTLPDDVERETIKASVNNGILSVELPKKAAEALPASRQIEIQ